MTRREVMPYWHLHSWKEKPVPFESQYSRGAFVFTYLMEQKRERASGREREWRKEEKAGGCESTQVANKTTVFTSHSG